ncbi:hypothetical protein EVAR_34644_1 [Eumeta japonica]|uniref:RNase H type-1 domain-containing protein n=1 Tax=Eumeta variegata TaxID=151549 RepID=A0A4C1VH43_EUMVA|nr:hypothetical protein EVAR_34644_1 [Eumeta japonica]
MDKKAEHFLAKSIRYNFREIGAEGQEVQLFWLKAHIGTAGNERVNELTKTAAQRFDAPPDYEKVSLSKKRFETILSASGKTVVKQWEITRQFLSNVKERFRILRSSRLTLTQVQVLKGHVQLQLEHKIEQNLAQEAVPHIVANQTKGLLFLQNAEVVFRIATKRNSDHQMRISTHIDSQ